MPIVVNCPVLERTRVDPTRLDPYDGSATTPSSHDDEAVTLERADGLVVERVERSRRVGDESERRRAPLAERALERSLLARRLVTDAARRALGRERALVAARDAREADRRAEIHECLRGRGREAWPVRRRTRSTFTSTGSTSSPNAKQRTAAAVYGPTPGSSSGRRASRPERRSGRRDGGSARGGCSRALPLADHVGRRRRRQRVQVGQRSSHARYRGTTRSTCVCWSMTSETRIAYGSRVRRHGRSRPALRTTRAGATPCGEGTAAEEPAHGAFEISSGTS